MMEREKCGCGRTVDAEMMQDYQGTRLCDSCVGRARRKAGQSRREFEIERGTLSEQNSDMKQGDETDA